MRAAGFATFPYKWAAFTLAGALAGLAGFLVAVKDGFVNPEMLSWHESGAVLLMLILGGMGRLSGAVLGAFAFALLQLFFQWDVVFGNFAKHWPLLLGGTIILCVAFMPNGLIGLPGAVARVARAQGARRRPVSDGTAPLLRARGVTRRFGGLTAVSDVSLDLAEGEIHAVIGTNGAGKSTLINVLSGEIPITQRLRRTAGARRHALVAAPARARGARAAAISARRSFRASRCSRTAGSPRRRRARCPWNWWTRGGCVPVEHGAGARSARKDRAGRARGPDGRAAFARREAAAGDRDVRRHAAARAAARRAARRHGRGGNGTHAGLAVRASRRGTRSCWSSTTWTRCSACRTASP